MSRTAVDREGSSEKNLKRLREDSQTQTNFRVDKEENADLMKPDGNMPISAILTDPKVLDCTICKIPLRIPVFQCDNGHLACSYCCTTRRMNNCSSCNKPIGSNRCRAIEKVLESTKINCRNSKYGCGETFSYSNKNQHALYCKHAPCSCPISDCKFVDASRQLYQHFSDKHQTLAVKFRYNRLSNITISVDDKIIVLQEEKDDGVLFILYNNAIKSVGNEISVNSITSLGKKFYYGITARWAVGTTLGIQSFTMSSQQWYDRSSVFGFLVVPSFLSSNGKLKLEICIWAPGVTPARHC